MKSLDQVEPRIPIGPETTPGNSTAVFMITQPGSYYLTQDILASQNRNGLRIGLGDVTVDLNGFSIRSESDLTQNGVLISASGPRAVRIRNGQIRDWGESGIQANIETTLLLEDLSISSNNAHGVLTQALTSGHFERCRASDNALAGFSVEGEFVFDSCLAESNTTGFAINGPSTLTDCIATNNLISGIECQGTSVLRACVATENGTGFVVPATGSTDTVRFVDCLARRNSNSGFVVQSAAHLTGCVSSGNSLSGFDATTSEVVVVNCTARGNAQSGCRIFNGTRAHISGNHFDQNGSFGLFVTGSSSAARITKNSFVGNGNNGLRVDGDRALIDGNSAEGNTGAEFAIRGFNSVVVRNTAFEQDTSGTGYSFLFPAENQIGPIHSSLGTIPASVSPWANFGQDL
ncbi:MAG: right-handed parallel beta-helix repeat-containing protein [Planctomycetota bacterium]